MSVAAQVSRDLTGQLAIVTGGGSGIGAAVCARLADAGAHVIVADIDQAGAIATAGAIGARRATALPTDISEPAAVQRLIARALRLGRLDVVVNNAAIIAVEPLAETSLGSWRRIFAVNVEGPLLLMTAAAGAMLAQEPSAQTGCRGKFINISSPAAEHGRWLVPAYGASKAALNHLSQSAAESWGQQGISTTVVYPGDVEGAMWPGIGAQLAAREDRTTEELVSERMATAPTGRFQHPGEVADAVLFVAAFRGPGLNGCTVWTQPHVTGP
jgi:NAD(P)-dependent dehydrogenase (short-subunit alcohol dehydrogenase family)